MVKGVIAKLRTQSCKLDGILMQIIKSKQHQLIGIITRILNLSLESGERNIILKLQAYHQSKPYLKGSGKYSN